MLVYHRTNHSDAVMREGFHDAWGAQIHPSCCLGVFVDESAESVASVELVWRVRADEV
jgi:hypothetical protein